MKLVKFSKKHYEILCQWWEDYGHPNVAFESLSPIGLICYSDEDKPLCLSFVYLAAGTDLGWICWTTGNPDIPKTERKEAIAFCIDGLFAVAKSYGKNHLVCYSQSPNVTEVFKQAGFIVGLPHDMLYGQVGT